MLNTIAREQFADAVNEAKRIARQECCTMHVNALCRLDPNGNPEIYSFTVDEWYDGGSTVETIHGSLLH